MTRAKAIEGLTLQEQRFVEAFCGAACGNATEAAALAKYKAKDRTALGDFARKLMRKQHIKDAIAARTERDPLVLTRVELQHFWSRMVRGDNFTQIADGRKISAPAQPRDRNKASELLAKTHRMFGDDPGSKTPTVRVIIELPDNGRAPPTIDVTPEPHDGDDDP